MRSGLPSRFSHQGPALLSAQHQQQMRGGVLPDVSNARLKVINDGFNEMDQAQVAHFAHKTGIELGIAAVLDRKLPPAQASVRRASQRRVNTTPVAPAASTRHFQANPVRAIEYLGYAIFRKDEASMAYEGAAMVKQRLAAQPMDVEVPAEEQAESSVAASLRTLPSPPPQPFSASEEIAIAEMLQQPLPLAAHNNEHWNRLQATAYVHTGPGQPNRDPTSSFHSSAAGPSAPPVPVACATYVRMGDVSDSELSEGNIGNPMIVD